MQQHIQTDFLLRVHFALGIVSKTDDMSQNRNHAVDSLATDRPALQNMYSSLYMTAKQPDTWFYLMRELQKAAEGYHGPPKHRVSALQNI